MNLIETTKIALLKRKIELIKNNAQKNGRFSLFHAQFAQDIYSKKTNYDALNFFFELINGWDEICKIPYEVGMYLDKLSKEYTVLIHRTRLNMRFTENELEYDNNLYSIMNDGLKNFGHAGINYENSLPDLTQTMTPLSGTGGYINLVASYKDNDTTIIAAFPKNLVNNDGAITDESKYSEIYDLSVRPPIVKPEYIIGAIIKKENELDKFYTRNEILQLKNIGEKNSK